MSYSISQDPDRVRLALSLQQKAGILNIRLIESTASCKSSLSENSGVPFGFAAEFQPEGGECAGTSLNVTTRFSFKIIREKDKMEVIVLNCLMGAEYALAEGFQPSVEQINAFKEGPAIFNCWPYFREYVQSTVVRMNYPPPTIPFLWLESRNPSTPQPEPVAESIEIPTKRTRKSDARKPGRAKR